MLLVFLQQRKQKNHPSLKKTGAKIHWGIDNPVELTKWGLKAHLFPFAKKAHRLLIYKIG